MKSFKFLFLICLVNLIHGESTELTLEGVQAVFEEANHASEGMDEYSNDLYKKAARGFVMLAKQGAGDAKKLYYNAGNSYFLSGDHGQAILNYRKVLLIDPYDSLALKNLEFVRSRQIDELQKSHLGTLEELLLVSWNALSLGRILSFIFIIHFLLWLLAACYWYRVQATKALQWMRYLGVGLVLCVFLLLGKVLDGKLSQEGVIVSVESIARKGDSYIYDSFYNQPLHGGVEFRILEERSDWLLVQLSNGDEVWLHLNDIARIQL